MILAETKNNIYYYALIKSKGANSTKYNFLI